MFFVVFDTNVHSLRGLQHQGRAQPIAPRPPWLRVRFASIIEPKSGESAESLPVASPLSRILVALAGPMMNVLFGVAIACLLWGVGMPVQVNPPTIGYVDPASPEAKLGIEPGDEILSVDGKAITSWHDVQETSILARSTNLAVVIARPGNCTNTRSE